MNDLILLSPHWLWLLALMPAWAMLAYWQKHRSQQDLSQFRAGKLALLASKLPSDRLMLLSVAVLILAMSRPAWNPQPSAIREQGRDMIFLLDVSRSMLAEDARPNRLEVARNAIKQSVQGVCSDRFGLAVFAGVTSIQSPLTCDQTFFNSLLDTVGPDSVIQGGTDIGTALTTVLEKMVREDDDARSVDIILITDGEDLGEHPESALATLNEKGARLLVIGLGDNQYGARVPARPTFTGEQGWAMDDGREHWSRLDDQTLRALAQEAEQGIYFPVGTSWFDLPAILDQLHVLWPGENRATGESMEYTEGYPWLLALAVLLQLIWLLRPGILIQGVLAAVLILLPFSVSAAANESTELTLPEKVAEADRLFEQQAYLDASDMYKEVAMASTWQPAVVAANYNLTLSLIKFGESQSEQMELAMEFLEEAGAESEMLEDPEYYYQEARQLLRNILLTEPDHQPSLQNLEYLALLQFQQMQNQPQDPQDSQQPQLQQEQQEENQDQDQQEAEQAESDESPEENNQQSKESSHQQEDSEEGELSFDDMSLPKPTASAKDILEESRARELSSEAAYKEQEPAARDW